MAKARPRKAVPRKTPARKTPPRKTGNREQKNPRKEPFTSESLDRTRIAIPLLDEMKKDGGKKKLFPVIIDVNLEFPGDRKAARDLLWKIIDGLPDVSPTFDPAKRRALGGDEDKIQAINPFKSAYSEQYLFGTLSTRNISALVRLTKEEEVGGISALYRIWLDHDIDRFTNRSVSTVKADAAYVAFNATGHDIIWAVADTGVDRAHRHFEKHKNLDLGTVLHRDFTGLGQGTVKESDARACVDKRGHGTHVAGIIAGAFEASEGTPIKAEVRSRNEKGDIETDTIDDIKRISGMAPACKILSLKVLDDNGKGRTSNVIAALEYVNELNGNGRRIIVQGVNLSVGYDFEPKWFACGQSPLCIEVNRLVRSGVVVVVAAGNTGYGYNTSAAEGRVAAGQDLTINDPGNADLAITVGATHRDMPHVYGVSYFSSKGPTGDGRLKPDLVAPGEKIISCRSGDAISQADGASDAPSDGQGGGAAQQPAGPGVFYKEDSGTSMAAPHVSGVIAAFLSARQEFIGRPDAVKEIFMSTATDLKRAVYFQGKGLVDLMRAIQSV